MHVLERYHLAERVYVVHDGVEALDFIFCTGDYAAREAANPPKMMLLDLKLPKVDGLEVLRRAKADPRTRSIPVVVFSSSWEDRDLKAAADLGADRYVVKPVDFAQFAGAVRAVLTSAHVAH